MKSFFYLLSLIIVLLSCNEKLTRVNKTVTLKGTIINYGADTLYMYNSSQKDMYFKDEIHKLPINENDSFEYNFELDSPSYFRVGRNILYLSPGDSLITHLDYNDRVLGSFNGKGSEANNYLTTIPYPRAASFWTNRELAAKVNDYTDMPKVFKESVKNSMDLLNSLTNVSNDFMRLEKARINFNYVNTLSILYNFSREDYLLKHDEANRYLDPYKAPFLEDSNSAEYLQLEAFNSILDLLLKEDFRKAHKLPKINPQIEEYANLKNIFMRLESEGYTREVKKTLKEVSRTTVNPYYKQALNEVSYQYALLSKGKPAFDLKCNTLDGSTIYLSDYKEKLIVIDLWATWCSPCMYEKPFFETLEKKYHDNKEIVFISLSVDIEQNWRNYFKENKVMGNQLQININDIQDYKVSGIPRFILIDRNFKIIETFAPRPSTGKLEALINEHILTRVSMLKSK